MTLRRLLIALAFAALVVVPSASARFGGQGAARPSGGDAYRRDEIAWSLPDGPTRTHSDIAFWGNVGVAGNYDGFRVFNKDTHQLYVSYLCRGPQNDVSLWRYQAGCSSSSPSTGPRSTARPSAAGSSASDTVASDPRGWEGIRIFDITNPASPGYVKAVQTDCGSHTHTLIPDLANNRLLIYVSSFPTGSHSIGGRAASRRGRFRSFPCRSTRPRRPRSSPGRTRRAALRVARPAATTSPSSSDPPRGRLLHEQGQIWDITDPANPDTTHPLNASTTRR